MVRPRLVRVIATWKLPCPYRFSWILTGHSRTFVRLDVRHLVQWNLKRKQHTTDQESELESLNDDRERRVSRHTYTSTLDNTGNTILVCYVLLMSSRPVPQKQDVSILCTSYVGDMPCLCGTNQWLNPKQHLAQMRRKDSFSHYQA